VRAGAAASVECMRRRVLAAEVLVAKEGGVGSVRSGVRWVGFFGWVNGWKGVY